MNEITMFSLKTQDQGTIGLLMIESFLIDRKALSLSSETNFFYHRSLNVNVANSNRDEYR